MGGKTHKRGKGKWKGKIRLGKIGVGRENGERWIVKREWRNVDFEGGLGKEGVVNGIGIRWSGKG